VNQYSPPEQGVASSFPRPSAAAAFSLIRIDLPAQKEHCTARSHFPFDFVNDDTARKTQKQNASYQNYTRNQFNIGTKTLFEEEFERVRRAVVAPLCCASGP
jgi:hypothetical protein